MLAPPFPLLVIVAIFECCRYFGVTASHNRPRLLRRFGTVQEVADLSDATDITVEFNSLTLLLIFGAAELRIIKRSNLSWRWTGESVQLLLWPAPLLLPPVSGNRKDRWLGLRGCWLVSRVHYEEVI